MTKSKKSHIYWGDRTLVQSPVYIGLCIREKDFIKELKCLGVVNFPKWITYKSGATMHTFEHSISGLACIVCIDKAKCKYTKEQTYAMLAHEAVHIWQEIKKYIGEDKPSDEFEAYSIQSICEELFKGYKKS